MTQIDPAWILAAIAFLTFLGSLVGVLWKFSRSVDKNTLVTQQILDQQKAQWSRIDETVENVQGHETRIVKLEAWKEFHEEAAK